MEKNTHLYLGMISVVIFLCWLIFLGYQDFQEVKDRECWELSEELGLKLEDGGNCCFIDDQKEKLIPKYRAVPCDNLDYVPTIERIKYDNLDQVSEIDLVGIVIDN